MSSDWAFHNLGDLASFKYGKFLAKSALHEAGFPVFSGYGVVGYLPDFQFEFPQLLIVCRGEGGTGDVKISPAKCSITNLSIVITPDEKKVSRDFLYWALKASDTHMLRTGSAQAQIVIGSLENFRVSVPADLNAQRAIASALNILDDRIALLRETNATLEAIAQALFKSWFVDFDPVHAKQAGLAPTGMDEATAALFPNRFTESPLGLVPEGWGIKQCQEIVDVRDGTHASPKPSEKGYPLVTSKNITGGEVSLDGTYLISEAEYLEISKRSKVDHLDVLLTMIGTVGIPAFVLSESTNFAIKNIGLFKTSKNPEFSEYIFLLLKSKGMQHYLSARMAGTTQKYLSLKVLREIEVLEPNSRVIAAFSAIMRPIFETIHRNSTQAQTLATLRDTLLPRLISGQLRLPDSLTDITSSL